MTNTPERKFEFDLPPGPALNAIFPKRRNPDQRVKGQTSSPQVFKEILQAAAEDARAGKK